MCKYKAKAKYLILKESIDVYLKKFSYGSLFN